MSLEAIEFSKFNRVGTECSLTELKERIKFAGQVDLFPQQKVAFLHIRWGESYHHCTDSEWVDFLEFLKSEGIPIRKRRWWEIWL